MKRLNGFAIFGVIAIIAIVAFISGATFLVVDSNNKATDYSKYDFNSIIAPDEHNGYIGDFVKGKADAPVLIFEYADYQCPGCASMNPRVNDLIEELDDKLAVVYRSDILPYHQNGTAAASAAAAAGLQGYWKAYSDLLFSNQAEWEYASSTERTALFVQYFEQASNGDGDTEKFKQDLASKEVSQKVSFDMGISKRLDVPATPAFYVDGQYIDWSNPTGSSITINGETFSWESPLSGNEFSELITNIVEAKLSK